MSRQLLLWLQLRCSPISNLSVRATVPRWCARLVVHIVLKEAQSSRLFWGILTADAYTATAAATLSTCVYSCEKTRAKSSLHQRHTLPHDLTHTHLYPLCRAWSSGHILLLQLLPTWKNSTLRLSPSSCPPYLSPTKKFSGSASFSISSTLTQHAWLGQVGPIGRVNIT